MEEAPRSPRVHRLPGTKLAPSPEAGARQVTNRALGPEGGGTARKWQSWDTRPELSDFEPLHSLCHPGGFCRGCRSWKDSRERPPLSVVSSRPARGQKWAGPREGSEEGWA